MEFIAITAGNVTARGQRHERIGGGLGAHRFVAAPVDELQQLHREFDVAQAPRAQLDLSIAVRFGNVVGDAASHGLDGLHKALALRRRPDERADGGFVTLAHTGVTRDRSGLEQRLELPGLGPPLVVLHVRIQRAHERPVLALGPQVGVHFPQGRFRTGRHDGACHAGRQARGDFRGQLFVRLLLLTGGLDVDDVHDVHVGNIVQLAGTTLAHPDHGQAHLIDQRPAPVFVGFRSRNGQTCFKGGTGQIGELAPHGRHVVHRIQGADVANCDFGDTPPVRDP